jgi:hypothetical protein
MLVLELYFLVYRIPKMMTSLARERNRSALVWSLIGIGAWIGAEFAVGFTLAMIYEIGVIARGWPESQTAGFRLVGYLAALIAALASATIVTRILRSKSTHESFPVPPLPPRFSDTNT